MRYFLLIFGIVVLAVMLIAGKRGDLSRHRPIQIFPDMKRQLKLRPQTPNGFFADGLSSQLPPPGTIAQTRPMRVAGREVYPFEDVPVNTGRVPGTTNFVELSPVPVSGLLLAVGGAQIWRTRRVCRTTSWASLMILALSGAIVLLVWLFPQNLAGLLTDALS